MAPIKFSGRVEGKVEREHVICSNCRYQFSYLYEAREGGVNIPCSSRPTPGELRGKAATVRRGYSTMRDAYKACPSCGYHQDWMVRLRRGVMMRRFLAGCAGTGVAVMLVLFVRLFSAVAWASEAVAAGSGNIGAWILGIYLLLAGVAAAIFIPYVLRYWDPNRQVDRSSYDAAPPHAVPQLAQLHSRLRYEAAARVSDQLLAQADTRGKISTRTKVIIGASLLLAALCALMPVGLPGMFSNLYEQGLMMLPFYLAAAFLAIGALGASWQFVERTRL